MQIANLPDDIKMELHNHLKKNIRKYYKGLKSGSLKYDFFVETMLSKNPKPNWLIENPQLAKDLEFRKSLIFYINHFLSRYVELEKENQCNSLHKKNINNIAIIIKERQELKNALHNKGYTLSIPIKFLTSTESYLLKKYILNGTPIPLGWEKILNYLKKST